jgi:energy-coupling factor transport system substrate-specific component
MKDIITPFLSKQKLMQTGISALIFIGMAVPFKVMVLIEGFTEVRPVNAVPVVAGLLLGPAGAWGCAFGNLIADLFGTFSSASILGFFGNFIAAYLPYKLWHSISKKETPNVKSFKNVMKYVFISTSAAFATAILLACGLDMFLNLWMPQVFWIIAFNDLGFPLALGLPVFIVLTTHDSRFKITMPEENTAERTQTHPWLKKLLFITLVVTETALVIMIAAGMQMSLSPLMLVTGSLFILSLSGFAVLD